MSAAAEVAEVAAMQEVSFMRLTDHQGSETEYDRQSIRDLGASGIDGLILEARQAWIKYEDGTAVTLSVYGVLND